MKTLEKLNINPERLLKENDLLKLKGGNCAVYNGEYFLGFIGYSNQYACTAYIRQFYPNGYCANCY